MIQLKQKSIEEMTSILYIYIVRYNILYVYVYIQPSKFYIFMCMTNVSQLYMFVA